MSLQKATTNLTVTHQSYHYDKKIAVYKLISDANFFFIVNIFYKLYSMFLVMKTWVPHEFIDLITVPFKPEETYIYKQR